MSFETKNWSDLYRQWLIDHPDMTECKLCRTVIRKKFTFNGLCPDCFTWNGGKNGTHKI